jgi:hypothetical protein
LVEKMDGQRFPLGTYTFRELCLVLELFSRCLVLLVILGVSILTYGTIVVLLCFSLILYLLVLGIFSLTEDIVLLNIFGYACALLGKLFSIFSYVYFHFILAWLLVGFVTRKSS